MKWVQCEGRNPHGIRHQYDPAKHPSGCPECGVPGVNVETVGVAPKRAAVGNGGTVAVARKNEPRLDEGSNQDEQHPRTIVHAPGRRAEQGLRTNPVVGWLVCTEGSEVGRDFALRAGNNAIGRDKRMDICVRGDEGISAIKAAIVSYEPKKRRFSAIKGEGHTILYVNDEEVVTAKTLKAYDVIELGQTRLMFIPFCGADFSW